MHRVSPLIGAFISVVLYIGINPVILNAAVEEPDPEQLEREQKVFVEPTYLVPTERENIYVLAPYVERRPNWGFMIGLEYNAYEPVYYQPNYDSRSYTAFYGSAMDPSFELQLTVKRNLPIGSIGIEVTGGLFTNSTKKLEGVETSLRLIPVRVGAAFYLDVLGKHPYFVPYASGGAYTMVYREALGGTSFNGNSQLAPYVNGGVAVSLDWVDPLSARRSFEESHLQTTYWFAEGRKYFSPAGKRDPDFGNDFSWASGFRIEY